MSKLGFFFLAASLALVSALCSGLLRINQAANQSIALILCRGSCCDPRLLHSRIRASKPSAKIGSTCLPWRYLREGGSTTSALEVRVFLPRTLACTLVAASDPPRAFVSAFS